MVLRCDTEKWLMLTLNLTAIRLHPVPSLFGPYKRPNIPGLDCWPLVWSDSSARHRRDIGYMDIKMGTATTVHNDVLSHCSHGPAHTRLHA